MSAIAGLYHPDGRPVAQASLVAMTDSLTHRGPDGGGVWCRGPVGLGRRMLWTTPESCLETGPLVDRTGDLVLTADARIDNREELLAALGMAERVPVKVSDGELILAAYEKWGERCPEKLLGVFAFAIWDGRRGALFCARDRFGIKPFYFFQSGDMFAFGSEIKALLSLKGVPRHLNEVRVADYLVPMFGDKVITLFQDIVRLPPAHSMVVDGRRVRQREYWSLDPSRELRLGSDEEYAEAFRELFVEAVRCRLRSAYRVGSLLSGGLDSSSVACTARMLCSQDGQGPVHTFSAIFDEVEECDERPYIEAVLAQGGYEAHYVHADRFSPFADLDRVLWHEDEAFYAPNLFMHWALFHAAHEQEVRVLFDGLDGDTTVSHGLPYLSELARQGRWISLYQEAQGLSKHYDVPPWRIAWRRGIRSLAPDSLRQAWRRIRGRENPALTANAIIDAHFARRIGLEERYEMLGERRTRPPRTAREEHYQRLTWGIIPFVLEVTDRAAAAFSLEARYPFFDTRLAEFCLALPPGQKLSQGWTRAVLHRAMEGILPPKVQWRGDKSNLSANFNRGLLTDDRALVEDVILDDPEVIANYVDVPALRETYARCLVSPSPANEDTMIVWKAVSLAVWLRHTSLSP